MEDREREPGGERAAQAPPRLLLCGGPIITMDAARPRVDALGVSGGLISAWGSEQAVAAALGEPFERVELDGAALLPGFIDAHHHYCLAALDRRAPDLHCLPGQPLAALIARLKPFVERCETPWVRAQGYDPHKLAERRAPRREELDEICPQRPLLLMAYSCHEGVLNSAGLELMGFTAASPDPPGGRLGRRRGRLTGEVIEAPFFAAEARSRDALLAHAGDAWLAECQAHGRALLRAGIVRVGDAAVPPAIDALYERAVAAGMLPVKVHRMPVGADSLIVARLAAAGLQRCVRLRALAVAGAPTEAGICITGCCFTHINRSQLRSPRLLPWGRRWLSTRSATRRSRLRSQRLRPPAQRSPICPARPDSSMR